MTLEDDNSRKAMQSLRIVSCFARIKRGDPMKSRPGIAPVCWGCQLPLTIPIVCRKPPNWSSLGPLRWYPVP
jgi:hypothetical protein